MSSIKRIIAEEDGAVQPPRAPRRAAAGPSRAPADEHDDDQVLELTDALPGDADVPAPPEEVAMTPADKPETAGAAPAKAESKPARAEARAPRPRAPAPAPDPAPATVDAPAAAPGVMSDTSAQAARESLVNLSKLLVRPEDGPAGTLEDLVREMLRPMLKEWLDANLPTLVETLVKREIDRITGRV